MSKEKYCDCDNNLEKEKNTKESCSENKKDEADKKTSCGCHNEEEKDCGCENIKESDCNHKKDCECENASENDCNQEETLEDIIAKRDELIALMEDQLKRQMAEFDNFRKRTEKEKAAMFSMGEANTLKKIIPIIDNFERGFATIPEDEEKTAFVTGMEMVHKQLLKVLEELNIRPIEAVGKEFDPNLHNAVSHIEKEDVGENIIVEEYEKGYMYKDTVLRHSMVIVAN